MDVVVQPSVPWMSLNDQIKDSGLFFPVDPGPSVSAPAPLPTTIGIPYAAIPNHTNQRGRLGLEAWWERAAGDALSRHFDNSKLIANSGTNAVRYGTMKDWVINLTVVLADGTVIKTRRRPRYDHSCYDLAEQVC